MFERITPPKMVPYAFVSFGSSRTRIAGMRSGIDSSFSSVYGLRSTGLNTFITARSTEEAFIMVST